MKPERNENDHNLADNVFICIILNEISRISLTFLWNLFPIVQITISQRFQVIAGYHLAASHYLNQCWPRHHMGSIGHNAWWRHQMETSSALLALCAGNSPVTDEFPTQRPVTRSFDVFFDLHLNKRLSKQSWGWCFETPSLSLWRHCDGIEISTLCFIWGFVNSLRPSDAYMHRKPNHHWFRWCLVV